MKLPILRLLAGVLGFACAAFAEPAPPRLPSAPVNLDFSKGKPGDAPEGWGSPLNGAEIAAGPACYRGSQCAILQRDSSAVGFAAVGQAVDAAPFRGGTVVFRAAVRTVVHADGSARLFVRIHTPPGGTSFFDNMGAEPIVTSKWTFYEIHAPVAADARDVEFGFRLVGPGPAWIDSASFTWLDHEEATGADAVRALIRQFADARNRHDGRTAGAAFEENAAYFNDAGDRIQGRAALTDTWARVPGEVQRTIQSVEMTTPHMAIVHATAAFDTGISAKKTYLVMRNEGEWKIRLMEAQLAAGR